MKVVSGELRADVETDDKTKQVEALVKTRQGAALEALLGDLRPVFKKHGLNIEDEECNDRVLGHDLIGQVLLPLVRERLWHTAAEEVLLGGRF